jgi:hypothetical protein
LPSLPVPVCWSAGGCSSLWAADSAVPNSFHGAGQIGEVIAFALLFLAFPCDTKAAAVISLAPTGRVVEPKGLLVARSAGRPARASLRHGASWEQPGQGKRGLTWHPELTPLIAAVGAGLSPIPG